MSRFKGAGWRPNTPSRTNTTSSIRGKISGPIPIPTAEDDEFPIRTPGAGMATPLDNEGVEKQLRPITPVTEHPPLPDSGSSSKSVEPSRTPPGIPTSARQSYESPVRPTTEMVVPTESISSHVPAPSIEKPQRKKSSIRSVFGRLFGRKRKDGKPASGRAGQHQSDPTALRNPRPHLGPQKRSVSLPINEFNRALRSHSPVTDGTQRQMHDSIGGSLQGDIRNRPRGATTPSKMHAPGHMDWGLTPRPASSHARGSKVFTDDEALAIGTAVTSGSHPNRRSRSLSYLREQHGQNAQNQKQDRRRSDEIRYWRGSYDPDALSPMSSQKEIEDNPIGPEASLEHEEPHPQPQPFNFGPMGELAGMKITQAASLETRVSRLETRFERVERAATRFHNQTSRSMIQLQDPPKAHSARSHSPNNRPRTANSDISLPRQPLGRMYQQTNNPQAGGVASQHLTYYDLNSRPSTTSTQAQSPHHPYSELSPPPSFITGNSRHQSSFEAAMQPQNPNSSSLSVPQPHAITSDRPLSTSTTIRAVASSSPPYKQHHLPDPSPIPYATSKHGSLTAHHYTALMNLIQAETTARQRLEDQVLTLQHQLAAALGAPGALLHVHTHGAYPTPSPDIQGHGHGRRDYHSATRSSPPRSMGISSIERMGAKDFGGIDGEGDVDMDTPFGHSMHNGGRVDTGNESGSESDTDSEYRREHERLRNSSHEPGLYEQDAHYGVHTDDDEDVFRTPNEERDQGHFVQYEAEMLANGGRTGEQAGRALSLSQLTLGKNGVASVNF